MARPIYKIAADILASWGPPPHQLSYQEYARPYAEAMLNIVNVNDKYGLDSADDIVMRFLVNVGPWHGEKARAIKAELKALLKERTK